MPTKPSDAQQVARIVAVRVGDDIELGIETEAGDVHKLLVSDDQADTLLDELAEILSSADLSDDEQEDEEEKEPAE